MRRAVLQWSKMHAVERLVNMHQSAFIFFVPSVANGLLTPWLQKSDSLKIAKIIDGGAPPPGQTPPRASCRPHPPAPPARGPDVHVTSKDHPKKWPQQQLHFNKLNVQATSFGDPAIEKARAS